MANLHIEIMQVLFGIDDEFLLIELIGNTISD